MTTTSIGYKAEVAAAEYLAKKYSFKILSRNWRTRRCEIDIVAESKSGLFSRPKTIHFIEVKYRKNSNQGDGLEYITDKKLQQMCYAAEIWVNDNSWSGDYQLDAVAVRGNEQLWQFDYRPNITS